MSFSRDELLSATSRWLATARSELSALKYDVTKLAADFGDRWRASPEFRVRVVRSALEGLLAAAIRGPRASALWLVVALAQLLLLLVDLLDSMSPRAEFA